MQKYLISGARLPQQLAAIQAELDEAIGRVMRRAVFTPSLEVEVFEKELADYLGVKYAGQRHPFGYLSFARSSGIV